DDGVVRRSRPQRRHHLGAPLSPHWLWLPGGLAGGVAPGAARVPVGGAVALGAVRPPVGGVCLSGLPAGSGCCGACSLDSVSWTVHAACSPVSTSKKPVRS